MLTQSIACLLPAMVACGICQHDVKVELATVAPAGASPDERHD